MANLVRLIKGVPIWLIFLSLSWASPLHVIPSADKGDSHDSGLHLSPASVLQSRASYDYSLAYESAVKKGKELECAMGLPAESAKDCFSKETSITSKFKDYSSLAENEWSMFLSGLDNSASWRPLQGPLKKLGISTDKKHWNWDRMAHRGKVGGVFANLYNAIDGVIVAEDSESPTYRARQQGSSPPALSKWSDVTFLEYQKYCRKAKTSPSNLRYIIRHFIDNDDALRTLRSVLGKDELSKEIDDISDEIKTLSKKLEGGTDDKTKSELRQKEDDKNKKETDFWKKYLDHPHTFKHSSKSFEALLSTPNVEGSAWFLIQHKSDAQLGLKKITEIVMQVQFIEHFHDFARPRLILKVESVPGEDWQCTIM